MAGYEYNPLLKEGFQKMQDIPEPPEPITVDDKLSSTSTNPVQNKVITAKLEEIEQDARKKVTKFFSSIEELEIEEIGQFQGEAGGDFVPGYFYRRNKAIAFEPQGNVTITRVYPMHWANASEYDDFYGEENQQLVQTTFTTENNCAFFDFRSADLNITFSVILFPAESGITGTMQINDDINIFYVNNIYNKGYLCENAFYNLHPYPLKLKNGQLYVFYNEVWYQLTRTGYDSNFRNILTETYGIYQNNMCELVVYSSTNLKCAIFLKSTELKSANCIQGHAPFVETDTSNWGAWTGQQSWTLNDVVFPAPFVRVDAQPSLDPSDFATKEQGEKADTALQSIGKGTDGDYITTTVTAKDANNQQRVGASLTIQDVATADSTHKGLAEASNVKAYAATAAQGAKADTALQSIDKGTDGDYITTTVTAKDANNQQTVGASLKIQDITAADNDHRGLLEALTTRNYIDKQIYDISLNFFFYGVQWDENDPSSDCTRIGNMSLHAELPVQNAIIGGLLQDDLTFTPFPDQSDWSGETVDGSLGQVMLQIPKHYFKSEIHGTIHKKLISQYPLAGFIEIPMIYVSAEKATVDRTDPNTPKLCSVVNMSAEFRGGNNTADWDGTYRSLLGFPASNISLINFRQYARNRAAGTAWNCHTYLAQRVLYWLFVIEYATLNSQKAFNAAKDANGYMQGGLGPGVSNWNGDAWNAYNGYNPLIPCGYMLEYGNQSAVKNYSVKDAADNVLVTFEVNSYRGIQSPFADIWDWTDGILINVQSDAAGGLSTCYITDDPAKFSSSDFSQYTELGNTPRADNWIKMIFDDKQGNIICKTQGSSSTSYYYDLYWGTNLPASGVSLRGVHFGGNADRGARCGFLCSYSYDVPANVHPGLGSRLCVLPPP